MMARILGKNIMNYEKCKYDPVSNEGKVNIFVHNFDLLRSTFPAAVRYSLKLKSLLSLSCADYMGKFLQAPISLLALKNVTLR